jgi:hypothetical protein
MLAFLAEPVPISKFVGRERFTRSGERNQYSLRRESRGSLPRSLCSDGFTSSTRTNSADSLRNQCIHCEAIAGWRARKMCFRILPVAVLGSSLTKVRLCGDFNRVKTRCRCAGLPSNSLGASWRDLRHRGFIASLRVTCMRWFVRVPPHEVRLERGRRGMVGALGQFGRAVVGHNSSKDSQFPAGRHDFRNRSRVWTMDALS